MRLWFGISLIPLVFTIARKDDENCWTRSNQTITNKYGVLVEFTPANLVEKESCSIHISNPWEMDVQNGFAIFPTRPIDCSSIITVECLAEGTFLPRISPSSVQYTCQTKTYKMEILCNTIALTYRRNLSVEQSKNPIDFQVVALAKEPCKDSEMLFQCPNDYPNSCLNRELQCNGRSECPSGDDERYCQQPSPAGVPIIVIVLAVLAFLILICLLSTVLVCFCCRAAFQAIIHRIWPKKRNQSFEKGEIAVVTGEDAGLMKDLSNPHVLNVLPVQHTEPAILVIDSTKPIYPRLQ